MAEENDRAFRTPGRLLGSLREALSAAAKDDTERQIAASPPPPIASPPPLIKAVAETASDSAASENISDSEPSIGEPIQTTKLIPHAQPLPSAAEAARAARGGTPNIPPLGSQLELDSPPTTRVFRPETAPLHELPARTQLVRGRQPVKRGRFHQDPVVGWLVVVGGPGLGAFRPIFEGNNTIGRSPSQRIPIDFGDTAISSEEQAYIRYDSADRTFLFVPNLAKTNVVSVNEKRPTAAIPLAAMDVITMGRTQLVFVPFCGLEFDWSELPDVTD